MIKTWLKQFLYRIEQRLAQHIAVSQAKESVIQSFTILSATNEKVGVTEIKRNQQLTVSLTTYGKRIHTVYLTIESILAQSLKADKIILWLAEDEFTYNTIPETLKKQEARGLTIKFCKDLRSYKKLIPTLKSYPNDLIITLDDDIIFPIDHIDRLYKAYIKEPNVIHCHRAHNMQYDANNRLLPYSKWVNDYKSEVPSADIFPTGGAGALYFPGCFHPDILNEALFSELCPHADDVWFKFMSYRLGIECQVVKYSKPWLDYVIIPESTETTLWSVNIVENDKQINALLNHFPDITFPRSHEDRGHSKPAIEARENLV